MRNLLFFCIVFLFSGCAATVHNYSLNDVVEDYFTVYAQRDDFEKFMGFYADNAQFKDIVYGNSFDNKAQIKAFLAWDKGEFKKLSGERILTVTKQTVSGNRAITEGYFHVFSYDGAKLGPWLFIISQEFDTHNKIMSQTDWINYTPRANFLGGKNMNDALNALPE